MTSDSPCCQRTARNRPRSFPVATRRSWRSVPGCHWEDDVPPQATLANPTGTPSRLASSSPTAGQIEPPSLPSGAGCGSLATRQPPLAHSRAVTRCCGSVTASFSSFVFVAYDCPAITNTSPTPTGSTLAVSGGAPSAQSILTSRRNHPRAGTRSLPVWRPAFAPGANSTCVHTGSATAGGSSIGTTLATAVARSIGTGASTSIATSACPAAKFPPGA